MMIFKRFLALCAVLAVAACGGGGGDAGTPAFGPGSGTGTGGTGTGTTTVVPSASDLVLSLSASSVANNGTETVVATATAVDANRRTVAGVPINFSVNNNAIATVSGNSSNASGQLTATVGIGSDRSNRVITVTATSGNITKTATLTVQDTGGGSAGTASDLLLTTTATTISNSGTQTVTVTATALDARRNVLPGVVVTFGVDAGGTAAPSATTTNASGVVTAQVGIGSNTALRTITVTATASGLPARTVALQVVNAPAGTVRVASDLTLALSASTLTNSGASTLRATVTAVDSNRVALAGIPVTISVDRNAVATVSGSSTDANGVVTANVGIGADRSNRSITITASSGSITKSATFAVVGATLSASFSPNVGAGSTNNQIEYRLVDAAGTPMVGEQVSVTAVGLPNGSGLTDVNGKYVYAYTAPTLSGPLNVVATAAGDTRTQLIQVQAVGTVPVATVVPVSASLTPTPSVVSVNAIGSTTNQVELRALFLGSNNQPVPNIRVKFSLDPANSSDGVATQVGGSVYAYSDGSGVARGTFTPGQRSSPTNGVTVRACWDTADFDVNATCPAGRTLTATLTITSEALSVNIRTNNLIKSGAADLTYIKEYVVMVVDAAGQAKPDILITPSVDLTGYYKGRFVYNGTTWVQNMTLADTESWYWDSAASTWRRIAGTTTQPACPNEDVNRNGVLESGEDLNGNGEIDPRKSDVAIKMVGSPRTDASGLAILQIEYGQNLASWVDFAITVTASGVAGTESRARYVGNRYGLGSLPYPASAIASEGTPPAFVVSPYGKGFVGTTIPARPTGVCTDAN